MKEFNHVIYKNIKLQGTGEAFFQVYIPFVVKITMILRVTLVLIYVLNGAFGDSSSTLRVDLRVKILKDQLERDMRSRHVFNEEVLNEEFLEPIQELRHGNRGEVGDDGEGDLVKPIMDYEYQKKTKVRHRVIKQSTVPTIPDSTVKITTVIKPKSVPKVAASLKVLRKPNVRQSPKLKRTIKTKKNRKILQKKQTVSSSPPSSKAVDIFYRKAFYNNIDLDATVPAVHCAAMVSPYFSGTKKQLAMMKVVNKTDHVVMRLVQLLNINTTDFVRDEVYSVLYQISQLRIRIWGWDLFAMNQLFAVITREKEKDKVANFKSLKAGLKRMFDGWKLDRSNTTRLLLQARVYRPPCLMHSHTGSSRFVPGSTVATKVKAGGRTESAECQNHRRQHLGASGC